MAKPKGSWIWGECEVPRCKDEAVYLLIKNSDESYVLCRTHQSANYRPGLYDQSPVEPVSPIV